MMTKEKIWNSPIEEITEAGNERLARLMRLSKKESVTDGVYYLQPGSHRVIWAEDWRPDKDIAQLWQCFKKAVQIEELKRKNGEAYYLIVIENTFVNLMSNGGITNVFNCIRFGRPDREVEECVYRALLLYCLLRV